MLEKVVSGRVLIDEEVREKIVYRHCLFLNTKSEEAMELPNKPAVFYRCTFVSRGMSKLNRASRN
jgi:hypothetical protein